METSEDGDIIVCLGGYDSRTTTDASCTTGKKISLGNGLYLFQNVKSGSTITTVNTCSYGTIQWSYIVQLL